MTPTRAATVSILLAGAALLDVVGASRASNDQSATAWFAGAGAVLIIALVANLRPATGRMQWWQRLRLYGERTRLRRSKQEGWVAENRSGLKGTLLSVTGTRGKTAAGFYCEVHGPAGVFDAYTAAAQKATSEARGIIGVFAMPDPSSNAFPEFLCPTSANLLNLDHRRSWRSQHGTAVLGLIARPTLRKRRAAG